MLVSEKVAMIRKLKGLTQYELAEKASLTLKTLQRIEAGISPVTGETIIRVANALNLTREEFEQFDVEQIFQNLKVIKNENMEIVKDKPTEGYVQYLESTIERLTLENVRMKMQLAKQGLPVGSIVNRIA